MLIFRSSCSQMFFKYMFLKISLYWNLFFIMVQTFFYRTPTVAASGFLRQQTFFSAKFGIYCWQSHQFLFRTTLKTQVKSQEQPLQLFCKKKVVLRTFANFTGKHLCWSLLLLELQTFSPTTLLKRDSITDVKKI